MHEKWLRALQVKTQRHLLALKEMLRRSKIKYQYVIYIKCVIIIIMVHKLLLLLHIGALKQMLPKVL